MATCDSLLATSFLRNCEHPYSQAGIKNKWYVNLDDIDKSRTVFDPTKGKILITSLALKDEAVLYKVEGVKSTTSASYSLSVMDYGNGYIHTDKYTLQDRGVDHLLGLAQLARGARIVSIVERVDAGENQQAAFWVYGYGSGMQLSEHTGGTLDNGGNDLITLSTMEGEEEYTPPKLLVIEDYEKTLNWLNEHTDGQLITTYNLSNLTNPSEYVDKTVYIKTSRENFGLGDVVYSDTHGENPIVNEQFKTSDGLSFVTEAKGRITNMTLSTKLIKIDDVADSDKTKTGHTIIHIATQQDALREGDSVSDALGNPTNQETFKINLPRYYSSDIIIKTDQDGRIIDIKETAPAFLRLGGAAAKGPIITPNAPGGGPGNVHSSKIIGGVSKQPSGGTLAPPGTTTGSGVGNTDDDTDDDDAGDNENNNPADKPQKHVLKLETGKTDPAFVETQESDLVFKIGDKIYQEQALTTPRPDDTIETSNGFFLETDSTGAITKITIRYALLPPITLPSGVTHVQTVSQQAYSELGDEVTTEAGVLVRSATFGVANPWDTTGGIRMQTNADGKLVRHTKI